MRRSVFELERRCAFSGSEPRQQPACVISVTPHILRPNLFLEERYHSSIPRHPQKVNVLPPGKPVFFKGNTAGGVSMSRHTSYIMDAMVVRTYVLRRLAPCSRSVPGSNTGASS